MKLPKKPLFTDRSGSVLIAAMIFMAVAAITAGTALSVAAFDLAEAKSRAEFARNKLEFESFASKTAFELYRLSESADTEAKKASGGEIDETYSEFYGKIFHALIRDKIEEYAFDDAAISVLFSGEEITVEISVPNENGETLFSQKFAFSALAPSPNDF